VPGVAVVTDTTQYLPRDVIERHGLHLVSLYVNWDGRTEREADLPDFDAFYDHMRSAAKLPSTSQPSVGDFLAVYEPLIERGDDIISIHLSGGISGTVGAAEQARQALIEQGVDENRMVVIDSRTGCAGHGFMALAAANADGGLAEKVAAARALREDLQLLVAVDTLEFLRRGGRIGRASAWAGQLLHVKPLLTIKREVVPLKRVRGNAKAMQEFVSQFRSETVDAPTLKVGIVHADAPERAEQLRKMVHGERPQAEVEIVTTLGAVVGTHGGPGTVGFFWFDDRE
jgi:DegV family protein with EDD domain